VNVNDEIRWLRERAFPVTSEDGDIIKGSGVVSDITKSKRDQELLDEQNRDIAESITYAKHIQNSTLQDEEDINRIFKEAFLFFLPKGELSGDFYIADHVNTNSGKKYPLFIVADCTGHGVPGAILSILCISLVRQTLSNRNINSPSEALDFVREQLAKIFQSGDSRKIKDGMDVGFGVIDEANRQIRYSGAKMTAFILRDSKWIEIKGSKQHVGYTEKPLPFKDVTFDYQSGDQLYMFTDGFVDQFGGENNKKYMKRRLMSYVASIADQPMEKQRELIEKEFHDWKGQEEQTDDICCFGLKLD